MTTLRSTIAFFVTVTFVLILAIPSADALDPRASAEAARLRRMGVTGERSGRMIIQKSSTSSVKSVSSSSGPSRTWVKFFKRYFELPAGWVGKVDDTTKSVVFTNPQAASTITITNIGKAECDYTKIDERRVKLWKEAGKEVEGIIGVAKAYGDASLGFKWKEPGNNGTVMQLCIVPRGGVLSGRVTVLASDTATLELVERKILAQIARSDMTGENR